MIHTTTAPGATTTVVVQDDLITLLANAARFAMRARTSDSIPASA